MRNRKRFFITSSPSLVAALKNGRLFFCLFENYANKQKKIIIRIFRLIFKVYSSLSHFWLGPTILIKYQNGRDKVTSHVVRPFFPKTSFRKKKASHDLSTFSNYC